MEPQQPSQGQPYPPQGYPPGQQTPPGTPQQGYQMGPPQWQPPPPKKGIPGWAIALIVIGVFMFFVIPILALAAIPLITTNTRDARRAEGQHMMGSARNQALVYFTRHGNPPHLLTETEMTAVELTGKYYRVHDPVGGNEQTGEITCSPISTPGDGRGRLLFSWQGPRDDGRVDWE